VTTHDRGHDAERRALDAYIKLMRASDSVAAQLKRSLSRDGLTPSQLGVLEALLHKGPLCQTDLSAKILKSTGNLTTVVDNLERRGLVRRDRNAQDRRFVTVSLTPEGRALIDGYFPTHAAAITRTMAALTPAEQDALAALCRKLGLAAADAPLYRPGA